MKTIELEQNIVGGENILTREALSTKDAIYLVKYDFKINGSVELPNGCELIIDGGSIKGGSIYLPCNGESVRNTDYYSYLEICSTSTCSINAGKELKYQETGNVYLGAGCRISSSKTNHFEMYLNQPCRIKLPNHGQVGTLYVESDKVNSIQIDGSCDFQIHAENCKFERIFANQFGWSFVNRFQKKVDYNTFENCEIWAKDYPLSAPENSNFLSLSCKVLIDDEKPLQNPDAITTTSNSLNWLIIRNSIITNTGINGTVKVDDCTFLFGKNCNNNYETIHCGNHSRITNCLFDGRSSLGDTVSNLNADVIDLFNGHDIIIDGCTFTNFVGIAKPCCNMITVKSHYSANPTQEDNPANSNRLGGPQNGVTIQNCHFDLPEFVGYIIEVWNGVVDSSEEVRSLNRQFTNIENNYMNCPLAVGYVHCYCYTDYLSIRNNVGSCRVLVFIPDGVPGTHGNSYGNIVHNLVIEGNILRSYDSNHGYTILYGSHIDNLEMSNNVSDRYLWANIGQDNVNKLSGTIRITNNETTETRGLFQTTDGTSSIIKMPSNINVFFSGNISKGKKTDVGSMSVANDKADGILFAGRQFFCTQSPYQNKFLIYNGQDWQVI